MRSLRSAVSKDLNWIVPASCAVALLYFGRDVLEPLALAAVLTLVMLPLVRRIRQFGLPNTVAVLMSVTLVACGVVGVGSIIAIQVADVVGELPRYEAEIHKKIEQVADHTIRPLARLESTISGLTPREVQEAETRRSVGNKRSSAALGSRPPEPAGSIESGARKPLSQFLSSIWGTLGTAAVVLILMVFMLLEHDSLRDRLIRFSGETDVARTMQVLSDTSDGVSRFFFCQFVVNIGFAVVIGVALWSAGLGHAVLWGALSGVLRFVPYLGVPASGAVVAAFAAAFDPGWSLLFVSLLLFLAIELLLAHAIEPHVYARNTGLAPLTVIVAALFWGTLWGPVGLLLSTPLTLCLVVAGRHIQALSPFAVLLGESPGLAEGLRFYKRVLSAEFGEILREAQLHLRRHGLASYYDQVLFPGLVLAGNDFVARRIDPKQQAYVRTTIVRLAESITASEPGRKVRVDRNTVSIADSNLGIHLRKLREERLGRWQGSLEVPVGSIVICSGFATERDTLLTELLVVLLRHDGIDARSLWIDESEEDPGTEKANLVSAVFIVYPLAEDLEKWCHACREYRKEVPHAVLVTLYLGDDKTLADVAQVEKEVDIVLHSHTECVAFINDIRKKH